MKILLFSDLHLEFGNPFLPPIDTDADLMILAGDIITFNNFEPLERFLKNWSKPVIFVAGNHEYYTKKPMLEGEEKFFDFIKNKQPNIAWLYDLPLTFGDVEFFGGTMWTDFNKSNPIAMLDAGRSINDFKMIDKLRPQDTVDFHEYFKSELIKWLEKTKDKKRVVITHHAPFQNQKSFYKNSKLWPAFSATDMLSIIEQYQPQLWCFGHTHECYDEMVGNTRVVSNQFGYHKIGQCEDFKERLVLKI